MKQIPLGVQKTLMWIPAANVLNVLIWFWNSFFWQNTLLRSMIILFTTAVPLAVLGTLITEFIPQMAVLGELLTGYLLPLLLSHRLIRYQEELLKNRPKGKEQ